MEGHFSIAICIQSLYEVLAFKNTTVNNPAHSIAVLNCGGNANRPELSRTVPYRAEPHRTMQWKSAICGHNKRCVLWLLTSSDLWKRSHQTDTTWGGNQNWLSMECCKLYHCNKSMAKMALRICPAPLSVTEPSQGLCWWCGHRIPRWRRD